MTKAQAKAKLKSLLEKIGDLRAEVFDLRDEIDDACKEVKPYKGRNSLRYEQERRKDWFEDIADTLNDLAYDMSDAEWELEDK